MKLGLMTGLDLKAEKTLLLIQSQILRRFDVAQDQYVNAIDHLAPRKKLKSYMHNKDEPELDLLGMQYLEAVVGDTAHPNPIASGST